MSGPSPKRRKLDLTVSNSPVISNASPTPSVARNLGWLAAGSTTVLPPEIVRCILTFHGFTRSLLDGLGIVTKSLHEFILGLWEPPHDSCGLSILKQTISLIPKVVLARSRRVALKYVKPFAMRDLKMLWESSNLVERVEEIRLIPENVWSSLHLTSLKYFTKSLSPYSFLSLRRIDFPKKPTGALRFFPNIESFRILDVFPRCIDVRFPILLCWISGLEGQLHVLHLFEGLPSFSSVLPKHDLSLLGKCCVLKEFELFAESFADFRRYASVISPILGQLLRLNVPSALMGVFVQSPLETLRQLALAWEPFDLSTPDFSAPNLLVLELTDPPLAGVGQILSQACPRQSFKVVYSLNTDLRGLGELFSSFRDKFAQIPKFELITAEFEFAYSVRGNRVRFSTWNFTLNLCEELMRWLDNFDVRSLLVESRSGVMRPIPLGCPAIRKVLNCGFSIRSTHPEALGTLPGFVSITFQREEQTSLTAI